MNRNVCIQAGKRGTDEKEKNGSSGVGTGTCVCTGIWPSGLCRQAGRPEGKKVGGKPAIEEYHIGKYSEAGQKNRELSQMVTEMLKEKWEK